MKWTTAITVLTLMSNLTMPVLQAEEAIIVPTISSPSILLEGTQKELSSQQIAELIPWAKNSKSFLIDLLDATSTLSSDDKIESMRNGIKNAVLESSPKNSELLMRYALNRGLVISDILNKEIDKDQVGASDVQIRILRSSINMALKYYDNDMATLTKNSTVPFATFGLDYFDFLTELNKSVFDASAQYSIQKSALEFLQWDLYRDLNNTNYASQIIKINNGLKLLSTKKLTDAQSISYIRQMKKTAEQLNFSTSQTKNHTQNTSNENSFSDGIYKSYSGTCYAMDKKNPEEGYLKAVVWQKCFDGDYKSYSGTCYAMSKTDKKEGYLQSVDWENCFNGHYKSYSGTCYAMSKTDSKDGYLKAVEWENCFDGDYKSYSGSCYAMSKTDKEDGFLQKVEWQKCFSGNYKSYSGTCYAMSKTDKQDGYLEAVEAEYCM